MTRPARTDGWSDYWLSSRAMTIVVRVEGGRVVDTPPIARKFIGQPFANLVRWMLGQGDLLWHRYSVEPEEVPEEQTHN